MSKAKGTGKREQEKGANPPEKYEIFVGNELAIQAIWKVIYPACLGEDDLASFLTNRAYALGIPLCQLKGKSREEMIKLILLDGANQKQPKKRWELYKDYHEADAARAAEKVIMSVTWAIIGWLYMDVIEGESRLDYLRRCEELRILKADGYREMKKLEKEAAKKEGGAK